MKQSRFFYPIAVLLVVCLAACATEENRKVEVEQTVAARTPYTGLRSNIAVGRFENKSGFMQGIFSDGVDRLGNQAKDELISHLQQTNRFIVLDRDNMEMARQEAELRGETQDILGASYVITGSVSEFGRKEVSSMAAFGILGRGKKQIAYSKVILNVVDSRTTAVVYTAQGAGEYSLSDTEVLGFGTSAGYDSTLNGKVLDLAIREAVDRLCDGIDTGAWTP